MVNAGIIAAKLAELDDRVSRIRLHLPATSGALATDRDALDLVSFNLMLAVQVCADVTSHLIADEGWPSATNLAAGFRSLAEHLVIGEATAEQLCRAVGLRNVVAHGYTRIDPEMVHAAATTGLDDLDTFAREVAQWTRAQTAEDAGS